VRLLPPLVLREGDRCELDRRANDPSLRLAERRRAQIVLLAAAGTSNTEIASRLGVSRPTVTAWRTRYAKAGLPGLLDGVRPGRPHRVDYQSIIRRTFQRPPSSVPRAQWTCRSLAQEVGVSGATVARAWRTFGVVPQPSGAFVFGTVPPFEATTVQVIALSEGRQGKVAALRLDGSPRAAFGGSALDELWRGDLSPAALVRECADLSPDSDLHIVADPGGRVQLRQSPAARAWWKMHPRLHLHGVSRTDSWDLLVLAWLCCQLGQAQPER
jgi:transposase